jgi:hypothetical protein
MSTADAYLPGPLLNPDQRTLHPRVLAVLCLAIAAACAAIVFAVLYHLDTGGYPIAAVRSYAPPTLPLHTATTLNALRAEQVSEPPESIARNHMELLQLEQLGTRNYIEFSLARSAGFQLVGPVEIAVWRIDVRHGSVQASVISNQRRIDFKRLKLNESISIPTAYAQKLELVVNGLTKNQMSGYVSEPKNRTPELSQITDTTVVKVP